MNNNLKYKNVYNLVICLSIIGFALIFAGTYSYFSKDNSYNVTGTVATWSFSADNSTSSFTKSLNDIIPGDSGSFVILLDASGSTSNIQCYITPDIDGSLAGMKIYADDSHSIKVTSDSPLIQTVAAGTTSSVTLYWAWEYDTGLLSSQNISFSINVVGEQSPGR